MIAGPVLAPTSADLDITLDHSSHNFSLLVTQDAAAATVLCSGLPAAPTGTDHVGWW